MRASADDVGAGVELPDEETFLIPAPWRRAGLLPRRGGTPGPALPAGPSARAAADRLVEELREELTGVLRHPASDPDLVAAAEAYLGGAESALGAAVVAGAASHAIGWSNESRLRQLADGWMAAYGSTFAALVVVELSGLRVATERAGTVQHAHIGHQAPGGAWTYHPHWRVLGGRVRAHLAAGGDEEYARARDALAAYRDAGQHQRVATSFLLPTEAAWVDADCRELSGVPVGQGGDLGMLLWCAASTPEQLELISGRLQPWVILHDLGLLGTAAEGVGPAIASRLAAWFDQPYLDATGRQRLLSVITALPTDEALRLLLDRLDQKYVQPAVAEAARRYPVRALRLLAVAAGAESDRGRIAAELLRAHVLTTPAAVEAGLPSLDEAARARVEAVRDATDLVPEAPESALPPVLVDPPWSAPGRTARPLVLDGLAAPAEGAVRWRPGERDEWTPVRNLFLAGRDRNQDWARRAAEHRAGRLRHWEQVEFFLYAPEELARPLLADWRPDDAWDAEDHLRPIVARFELDALPAVLHLARRYPTQAAGLLAPYADAEVAELMADCSIRLKSVRPVALAWLVRHPESAARGLLPPAFGKAGARRRAAEHGLRTLAAAGHEGALVAAAQGYGPAAVAAVEALLAADPLHLLPAKIPVLPAWADPGMLPQVLLRDRQTALPQAAVRHLCTMLAISQPDAPYAGVPRVVEVCDPASLAEFGWALFQRWRSSGSSAKEGWTLQALRWLGDDETVRRLAPVIRAWPGEGGHARAVVGLDVLAAIGTDVALMHLYGISQKVKFAALREQAGQRITEVAADLGLSAEQLGDRLVPDLGLDADGSLVLDYGPRRFTVGFDEQLKPYVADGTGARRKALPKPGARDDERLAPAAYQRFGALKKDVRTLAADQIRRLERAMVTERRWSGADFRRYFVAHPLLWHIVRRLVWATWGPDGEVRTAFRVAEDRTLADVADDTFDLDDAAEVGIAHPVRLGTAVPAWSELLADYEILQPFPQLGREVHRFTEEELAATRLTRFEGIKVAAAKLVGLERRGWERGTPEDAGIQGWVQRRLPGDRTLAVHLDPGIPVGDIEYWPVQQLREIELTRGEVEIWRDGERLPFGVLDPVTASELLRDLVEVTA
ncbi:DUF4132 domain-containing protein [Micromonospora sp. NPDC049559]|uniref:DUF4132 domain-containing protein n=1 Tax=Micromonospora sp. NPDC049559 TaxID=3155923 RepID=UPI00341A4BDE